MNWVYLSPHFDDAVLSCGGLVWEQTQSGENVDIWTICAGVPPTRLLSDFAQSLHTRWETGSQAAARRRQEDANACNRLSAVPRQFPILDCIYRRSNQTLAEGATADPIDFLYASEEALFGPLHPAENRLIGELSASLEEALTAEEEVVAPLALGGHVDHRLTRTAAEGLGRSLWYYADYPYVIRDANLIPALRQAGWQETLFSVSPDGLKAWQEAIAAHRSQISTFWPDLETMYAAIQNYLDLFGGVVLWKPPPNRQE
jgi:LmbE family N-acetylglucosaminyl deacetylase